MLHRKIICHNESYQTGAARVHPQMDDNLPVSGFEHNEQVFTQKWCISPEFKAGGKFKPETYG
jgi:hypothetical protein